MKSPTPTRPDLLLLLSLLAVILLYPVLDRGELRRAALAGLMFVPVIVATIRLSEMKGWLSPSVVLMIGAVIAGAVSTFWSIPMLEGIQWTLLTLFFAMTVAALFSYLKDARSVSTSHLYTAASTYLLLGMMWFSLYSAIDVFYPDAILHNSAQMTARSTGLLYFSLITLSTVGYGDIVPIYPEVRVLAALEGITGVLYVAITVALLVSAYKGGEK